jgi:threonine aldolase
MLWFAPACRTKLCAFLLPPSALFLPSRTMGNLISIMVWCSERGSSFICGEKSHVFLCEEGGASQVGARHHMLYEARLGLCRLDPSALHHDSLEV